MIPAPTSSGLEVRLPVADTDKQFEVVRKAFEDAMREHYPIWSFASDGCGGYHNERTELAWQGWMACFIRMTASGVKVGPPWCCEQGEALNMRVCPDCAYANSALGGPDDVRTNSVKALPPCQCSNAEAAWCERECDLAATSGSAPTDGGQPK